MICSFFANPDESASSQSLFLSHCPISRLTDVLFLSGLDPYFSRYICGELPAFIPAGPEKLFCLFFITRINWAHLFLFPSDGGMFFFFFLVVGQVSLCTFAMDGEFLVSNPFMFRLMDWLSFISFCCERDRSSFIQSACSLSLF